MEINNNATNYASRNQTVFASFVGVVIPVKYTYRLSSGCLRSFASGKKLMLRQIKNYKYYHDAG